MTTGPRGARPRIALATRIYAPEAAAGAFRLTALTRALTHVGPVRVLTVTAPGEHVPPPGVRVSRWPVLRDRAGYVRGYLPYLSFDLPLALRLLLMPRPDVVVAEPPPTTGAVVRVIAALRRVPYVWYAADVWSDATAATGAPRAVTKLVRAAESFVLRGAAAVLSVSDGVTERVQALGATEVTTVGNGVDSEIFTPDGDAEPLGHHTFLYAGTASEWQGADIFVRALVIVREQVPDARLVFLGQGSAWEAIGRAARSLPAGAVRQHASVPAAQSARWLRGARAAVVSIVPGQGYDFAVPTKVFAALGSGTPVVYAGVGPVVDLLAEHGLGVSADYDVAAVAGAMLAALALPTTQGERRRRGAFVAERRSLQAAAREASGVVAGVLEETVSDGPRGRRRRRASRSPDARR